MDDLIIAFLILALVDSILHRIVRIISLRHKNKR